VSVLENRTKAGKQAESKDNFSHQGRMFHAVNTAICIFLFGEKNLSSKPLGSVCEEAFCMTAFHT
jgi:hypothetical protein